MQNIALWYSCNNFRLVIRFKAINHLTNLTCLYLSMHIWYIWHSPILIHTFELLIGF